MVPSYACILSRVEKRIVQLGYKKILLFYTGDEEMSLSLLKQSKKFISDLFDPSNSKFFAV
ncbi:hypothetical protein ACVWWR_003218 [Bradyrhizobium sp. LM3.2]